MGLTIAITGLKGGIGKSTVALNLAAFFHQAGHRTLLVDADSQATLRTWSARASEDGVDGPPVVGIEGKTLRRDLEQVSKGFDLTVIDSPPRLGTEARAAMISADLVLLPVVPGAADVWALQETLGVLQEAQDMRPELKAAVVLNRADRTTLATMTRDVIGKLEVPILKAKLTNRVAFGEATLAGMGVVDYAPDSPAAAEVKELAAELLRLLGGKKRGSKK